MKPVMTQNKFLHALPLETLEKLDQHAEIVKVDRGFAAVDSTSQYDFVYFPITCVFSLELPMADGFASHIALLGCRHVIGTYKLVDLSLPGVPKAIIPGYAVRVRSEIFVAEMTRRSELRRAVHQQFVEETRLLGVMSGCNLRHPLQRQLVRWLLSLHHVSGAMAFELTHEDIGYFLGVRREAITEALSRLTQAGVLQTSRGRLSISDPALLSGLSCECGEAFRPTSPYLVSAARSWRVAAI